MYSLKWCQRFFFIKEVLQNLEQHFLNAKCCYFESEFAPYQLGDHKNRTATKKNLLSIYTDIENPTVSNNIELTLLTYCCLLWTCWQIQIQAFFHRLFNWQQGGRLSFTIAVVEVYLCINSQTCMINCNQWKKTSHKELGKHQWNNLQSILTQPWRSATRLLLSILYKFLMWYFSNLHVSVVWE